MDSAARTRPLTTPEARKLLFLRAAEESDAAGSRISLTERAAAGRAVLEENGTDFLKSRAERIFSRAPEVLKAAAAKFQYPHPPWPRWLPVAVPVLAFLVGWFTNELGADRRVSLLAFPLLGLMVWNLAVVAASLISSIRKKKRTGPPEPGFTLFPVPKPQPSGDAWLDGAESRADQDWRDLQAPVQVAKGKLLFHAAAILLTLGVVAGMYARGLVRAYEAGWESTFLTRPEVSKLARVVLGPASVITRIPVPEVPPQGQLSPAAPWIHLWAASAGLLILLPRFLLVSSALREIRLTAPDWRAVFSRYENTARQIAGGQPLVAWVLPVQCQPDSPLRDRLRAILQHLWGGQVIVDFQPDVAYGDEDECLEALVELPGHLVLLMPFAVTPEHEVHGVLAQGLLAKATAQAEPVRALVVLDATVFEARLQGMPERERRMAERRSAWEKVLGGGFPLLILDEAARRSPGEAAAAAAAAREPVRPWTAAD
ncbi:MAG: hypothetical protein V4726_16420 [Verrucomicrobiota bacterium]